MAAGTAPEMGGVEGCTGTAAEPEGLTGVIESTGFGAGAAAAAEIVRDGSTIPVGWDGDGLAAEFFAADGAADAALAPAARVSELASANGEYSDSAGTMLHRVGFALISGAGRFAGRLARALAARSAPCAAWALPLGTLADGVAPAAADGCVPAAVGFAADGCGIDDPGFAADGCAPKAPGFAAEGCGTDDPGFVAEDCGPDAPGFATIGCGPVDPGFVTEGCAPDDPEFAADSCAPTEPGSGADGCGPAEPGAAADGCGPDGSGFSIEGCAAGEPGSTGCAAAF